MLSCIYIISATTCNISLQIVSKLYLERVIFLHAVSYMFLLFSPTDHLCDTPGCGSVLVLDGNMKNCHQICACRDIGELKFAGLQRFVVVGVSDNVYVSFGVYFTQLFS